MDMIGVALCVIMIGSVFVDQAWSQSWVQKPDKVETFTGYDIILNWTYTAVPEQEMRTLTISHNSSANLLSVTHNGSSVQTQLDPRVRLLSNAGLLLRGVRPDDSGAYVCRVVFSSGHSLEHRTTAFVHPLPKWIDVPKKKRLCKQDSTELTWSFSSGLPVKVAVVSKDVDRNSHLRRASISTQLKPPYIVYHVKVTMKNVTLADAGVYESQLSFQGRKLTTQNVTVTVKPVSDCWPTEDRVTFALIVVGSGAQLCLVLIICVLCVYCNYYTIRDKCKSREPQKPDTLLPLSQGQVV